MQIGEGVAVPLGQADDEEKCKYCKKAIHPFAKKMGNNIGSGTKLGKNIIPEVEKHTWYTSARSLQAHHLICSEAMDDDEWNNWCTLFGYDINCKENGVMLPYEMALACQLHVPLHRGNHANGMAGGVAYPDKITSDLKEISNDIKAGKYCDKPNKLTEDLNEYSEFVLGKVDKFIWTITGDGRDYKTGGIGCAGVKSVTGKPSNTCPQTRSHNLSKKGLAAPLMKSLLPLMIGK